MMDTIRMVDPLAVLDTIIPMVHLILQNSVRIILIAFDAGQ